MFVVRTGIVFCFTFLIKLVNAGEWLGKNLKMPQILYNILYFYVKFLEPRMDFAPRTERLYNRFTYDLDSSETEVFLEMVTNEHGKAEKATSEAVLDPKIVQKVIQLQTEMFRRQGMSESLISVLVEVGILFVSLFSLTNCIEV